MVMTDAPVATGPGERTALLHIGLHKTGTTSFQSWASANAEALAVRAGVRMFHGLAGANAHDVAVACLRRNRTFASYRHWHEWCLDEWREVCGPDRVVTLQYEDAMAAEGTTIPGVLDALGISRVGLPSWDGIRENTTPSPLRTRATKVMRAVKTLGRALVK